MSERGLLIVFSGPSGSGKDTVLTDFLQCGQNVVRSVSATTRAPRPGEQDGRDYFFVTRENFLSMVKKGEMLEYAEYCGNFYGTPAKPIERWLSEGCDVILKIEVQGGAQIKKKAPDCVSIFLLPPSLRVLEQRLRGRNTDTEEGILKRLETARDEILQAENYDYIVINQTVQDAVEQIHTIIAAEKHRFSRASFMIERVLNHAETIC